MELSRRGRVRYQRGNHPLCTVYALLFCQNKAICCVSAWPEGYKLHSRIKRQRRLFCPGTEQPLHSQPTLKRHGSCLTAYSSSQGPSLGLWITEKVMYVLHSTRINSDIIRILIQCIFILYNTTNILQEHKTRKKRDRRILY